MERAKEETPKETETIPIAMVPHKSPLYRAILDLFFIQKLADCEVHSVNDTTEKMAQKGINQIGGSLLRIIEAMAEADENKIIVFAKWDIKDGFWRCM